MKRLSKDDEFRYTMLENSASEKEALAELLSLPWEKVSPILADHLDKNMCIEDGMLPKQIAEQIKKRTYEIADVKPEGYVYCSQEECRGSDVAVFSANGKTYAWFGFVGNRACKKAKLVKFETKRLFHKPEYTFILLMYSHKNCNEEK